QAVSDLIPRLTGDEKKGDCGRLAVFGGSEEYPGAPFYAATAMLRLGADLAHIFTEPAAATVIKNYSPEVLVGKSPAFPHWLAVLDGVLIGPGAGRDGASVDLVSAAIRVATAAEPKKPVVIDADGLWALVQSWMEGDRFPDNSIVILTPNANEMDRLAKKFVNDSTKDRPLEEVVRIASSLAESLNCHLFVKGREDVFVTPKKEVFIFSHSGSLRRPGGIGDCLAGLLTTFVVWAHKSSVIPIEKAAEAASYVTREASRAAYEDNGRGMNATDVIAKIVPLIKRIEVSPFGQMNPVSIVVNKL
ncbi:hypothetical protein PENTCL1PPCAC_18579, partial [Pristionchus entomophagus]